MLGLALNESTIYIYIILANINLKWRGRRRPMIGARP